MLTGQIFLQLVIILLVVQAFGYLCQRLGQQWVVGEILAGLALGPSLLGLLFPALQAQLFAANTLPTLQTLGDIGLVLYMFSLGAQLDISLLVHQSRKALFVSGAGMLFPLLLGAGLAPFLYTSLAGANATPIAFILLMGIVMSITAFPVLARLLVDKGMLDTKIGSIAIASASIGDVVAWCLLAIVASIITSKGIFASLLTVVETIAFTLTMGLAVRPLLKYVARKIQSQQTFIAFSILLLLVSAYISNVIGIHPVFGAFIAGIILPRNVFFTNHVRHIDQLNSFLFLPLFFVFSGLRTQVAQIQGLDLWLVCLLIIVIACVGKICGGTLAVRLSGDTWREALAVGVLMNTRGLVELIVLNLGLELKVLSPALFSMLVLMAITTTMLSSPLLTMLGYKNKTQRQSLKTAEDPASVVETPLTGKEQLS
ncbi:cation:proton antiporter domain-containing protein [Dictyobacter formicarum]|uniref:Cation/H+ exchanger transmembrane domain-containing protein n=1 Tax=Dictyobacter formicarum TaxID=2778368 RepID=A0ABQ3VBX7_9CHLR|nr:cation:proton antiporter [Dictyobacter formicarum]GHO83168.1 hypothetical protein KSZ_11740 [Dictyobacter formicarum]